MQNLLKKIKASAYLHKLSLSWIAAIITFLIIIYGGIGFFVVPGIINDKAQQFVSEKFQRKLEFRNISLNPFTLTATMEGMRLTEPQSEDEFVSFESLTVNLSSQSLFRMAPVIEEIRLVNPRVNLIRTGSNHYNFDDFIAFASEPKEDDSPAKFSINNIQIENAVIAFDDQPKQKRHVVDELNVSVPFISSIPSQVDIFVDLVINGRFNGEKIGLTGKARPFFRDKDGTVNVRLDRIDLPAYIDYLPFKPNFALKEGKLSIDLDVGFGGHEDSDAVLALGGNVVLESLWLTDKEGKQVMKLPELGVKITQSDILAGKIEIDHIQLKSPEVYLDRNKEGQWNVERLAKIDSVHSTAKSEEQRERKPFSISLGKLSIDDGFIAVRDQIHVVPADFTVSHFGLDVEGILVDVAGQTANVEKVVSANTEIKFVHGKLKWQEKEQTAQQVARKAAKEVGDKTNFNFHVGRIELNDWGVHFENKDAEKPIVTKVDGLNIAVDDLSSDPEQAIHVSVGAKVNQKGSIAIAGNMNLSPFKAGFDLDIRDVDIRFIQPYIEDFVNLSIRQADLTIKGKLQLAQGKDKALQGQFVGDAGLSRLSTVDQLSTQPFLGWKDLSLKGIRVDLMPLTVNIDQIRLDDLMARVILSAQGRLNLQDILRSETGQRKSLVSDDSDTAKGTASVVAKEVDAKQEGQPDYSIQIKRFLLNNGKIRFSDNFIRPRYTADLVNLRGAVSGLSTNPKKQAVVDVKGQVNGAPLLIAGVINPLSQSLSMDIKAKVKGMELAQFSAYSGKYVGYGIAKGKLSFDVAYKIQNEQLSAENSLILDQLTLGDKVESPSAMNLPVHLALSLLKDRNGVIDINLPIGGSLNDPEFSVGGIILKVIVNLIQKAVTAPFSLLASIAGDSEELSFVVFEPGSYAISDAEQKKLESLARALENRPGLSLEIAGRADPNVDSIGLGKQMIMSRIRAMKAKDLGEKADVQNVTVSENEYPELLKRLYGKESFKGKPKNWIGFSKSVPVAEMERLLSQHFAGKQDDLGTLANNRAQVVKEWLLEKGKIADERLFIVAGHTTKAKEGESGNRVDFSLK